MAYSKRTLLGYFVVMVSLSCVEAAHAQSGDAFALDETAETAETAETTPAEDESRAETSRRATNPYEDPKKSYLFAGAAWRYVRLPSWTLEWFLEAAPGVGSAGSFFGEFGYRKDGFQITGAVGYMKWSFAGPFQIKGDPELDTEWLDGDFKLLQGTATFTWSTAFTAWFALEYGLEVGLAAVFGDLVRSEGYKDSNGKWARCPGYQGGPDLPNPTPEQRTFCEAPIPLSDGSTPRTNTDDDEGAHYGVNAERVPPVVPILGPRLSLRFKPIAQLVLRVDVPLPLFPYGFVGGIAAQYGI